MRIIGLGLLKRIVHYYRERKFHIWYFHNHTGRFLSLELIRFCREQGCAVTAMSTFSHFRTNNPRKEIFENELLQGIAEKHHKSVAQIVLRWLVQQDIIIIPKTWFHEHLVENISIEDFSLSNNEMELIDSLDQGKFLNYNPYKWYSTIPAKYKQSFNNRG